MRSALALKCDIAPGPRCDFSHDSACARAGRGVARDPVARGGATYSCQGGRDGNVPPIPLAGAVLPVARLLRLMNQQDDIMRLDKTRVAAPWSLSARGRAKSSAATTYGTACAGECRRGSGAPWCGQSMSGGGQAAHDTGMPLMAAYAQHLGQYREGLRAQHIQTASLNASKRTDGRDPQSN